MKEAYYAKDEGDAPWTAHINHPLIHAPFTHLWEDRSYERIDHDIPSMSINTREEVYQCFLCKKDFIIKRSGWMKVKITSEVNPSISIRASVMYFLRIVLCIFSLFAATMLTLK